MKEHQHRFNATQYEMRDLNSNDIEGFLGKWFNDQNKTSEVLEWLAADHHRQRLTAKPLHLVLLATITKKTKREEWPETPVLLYGKFIHDYVDKRIDEQTNGKGVDEFKELGEDLTGTKAHNAILHGFYYLGWVLFQQQNGLYIYEKKGLPESKPPTTKEQVSICLQNGKGYSTDTAAKIFSFWQRTGVPETFQQETDEQETNVQESFHQTFWAYAAACKLYDDWQTDAENTWHFLSSATRKLPYASRLHHPDWQEPILMLAALAALKDKKQLNNLISRLLSKRDKEERYLHQNLRLAAAILGEIETGKIDEKYERRIINQLGRIPKDHTWKRALIQLSIYTAAIISIYLLLPLWAFGSIVFIGIDGTLRNSGAFEDDSPPSDLFKIVGPFWLPLMDIFILIINPIITVLSWPLFLLRWQAIKATEKDYVPAYQAPPKYIWEHWLFQRIALFIGCALVVFIFYQLFPLWLWGIILLFWLFDIINWTINRYNASSILLQLSRPVGRGIGYIHKYLSTLLIKVFRPSTFNANINSNALAKIGSPAIPQLKQMLIASSQDVRQAAIRALGQTKSPEAADVLVQPLIYGNRAERYLAIEALVNIRNPSAISALVFVWKSKSQEYDERKAIIQALMEIDKKGSLPIIANMVGDYDQPFDILNPPEFIQNYVPPTILPRHLSPEERVREVYEKLSATWNRAKNLPFLTFNDKRNGPSSGVHGSTGGASSY